MPDVFSHLKTLCIVSAMAGSVGLAQAQEKAEKIETDRPDQTEAASVVPTRTIQLETGYFYQKNTQDGQRVLTHAYPTTTVRVGVLKGVEMRINIGLKDSVVENGSRRRVSGMGPLNLGTKVKLWSGGGWVPDASFIARATFPVGSAALSPGRVEPHFRLNFKNELTEKLDLGYNLVYHWVEKTSMPAYAVSVGYELSDRFTFFAEVFGEKKAGEASQHQGDAGLLFFLLPHIQFDVAMGRALTADAPDYFVTAGVSFRLPR